MTTATSLLDLPARFFHGQDDLRGSLPSALVAADYRADITGFPTMDAAGHAGFGQAFYAAFPDLNHTIDEAIVAGEQVVTRFTLRGSHQADFMGIPPTGKHIAVSAIVILDTAAGRVRRLRAIFDQLGLMRQLGVLPG